MKLKINAEAKREQKFFQELDVLQVFEWGGHYWLKVHAFEGGYVGVDLCDGTQSEFDMMEIVTPYDADFNILGVSSLKREEK